MQQQPPVTEFGIAELRRQHRYDQCVRTIPTGEADWFVSGWDSVEDVSRSEASS